MATDRSQSNPHISIIIPAFNEAAAITATMESIANQLTSLSPHWDIVVIDDGSRDRTADIVRSLPAYLHVTLLRFSRNFGKEYAIARRAAIGTTITETVIHTVKQSGRRRT